MIGMSSGKRSQSALKEEETVQPKHLMMSSSQWLELTGSMQFLQIYFVKNVNKETF